MKAITKKRFQLTHLILLHAFSALATDMYLPALPNMVEQFNSTLGLVNMTLVLFFIFFAGSMLFWGTISDKYGRRPTLLIGVGIFTASSLLCAVSNSIYMLLIFRIFQGIGSAAGVSISMAVIKDVFEGKERERALAFTNVFFALAPILAPVIGAAVLQIMSWRGIFIVLGGFGIVAFIGCLIMKESAPDRSAKSLGSTLGNLPKVLRNPGFSFPLLAFAPTHIVMISWLGASSSIYITDFGLSEQAFSFFFAFNAFFLAVGPVLFLFMADRIDLNNIIISTFLLVIIGGILLILFGPRNPYIFALSVLPATLGVSIIRPPSANILLEQGKDDAGAASSLMNFTNLFIGSMGMLLVSLDWENRIFIFGVIHILAGLVCISLWPMAWKKCKPSAKL